MIYFNQDYWYLMTFKLKFELKYYKWRKFIFKRILFSLFDGHILPNLWLRFREGGGYELYFVFDSSNIQEWLTKMSNVWFKPCSSVPYTSRLWTLRSEQSRLTAKFGVKSQILFTKETSLFIWWNQLLFSLAFLLFLGKRKIILPGKNGVASYVAKLGQRNQTDQRVRVNSSGEPGSIRSAGHVLPSQLKITVFQTGQ